MDLRRRRGIGSAVLAAAVVVVVVAAVATAFVIDHGASTSGTTTLPSTTSGTPSLSGLLLSVTVNSSTLAPGHGEALTVKDTNTLSTPLNMSRAANWPFTGLATGPCGALNQPVGLAVVEGNYDLSNVSSATPLQLYAPGAYPCAMALAGIQSYLFQPTSDNATIYGGCTPSGDCGNETVSATVSVRGYYPGASLTSFPAGVYTVVAGDEWGDIVVSHFVVN